MKKRVRIPKQDPKALLDLAKKMRTKHIADGDASPLKIFDWADLNTMIDETIAIEDRALQLKREKLLTYQKRRIQLSKLTNALRNTRDLLTAVHSEEMKVLGLWGFDVLDNRFASPDEPAPSESRIE